MKLNRIFLTTMLLSSAISAYSAPIVRYFELTTEPSQQQVFDDVGVENLSKSIETETGTLAMYASHKADEPNLNYVFEIYQDDDAYQIHTQSPQFKKFVEVAKTAVVGRKVVETTPQLLAEKIEALREVESKLPISFTEITVKPEFSEQFKHLILGEMKNVMQQDDRLVLYAVTLKDDPNQWRFFEILRNGTELSQDYLTQAEKMIAEKNIISLQGGTLMNKGGIAFKSE